MRLEIVDGPGGEGVCYDLPLSRVFVPVSDVEHAGDAGDESFVVDAIPSVSE